MILHWFSFPTLSSPLSWASWSSLALALSMKSSLASPTSSSASRFTFSRQNLENVNSVFFSGYVVFIGSLFLAAGLVLASLFLASFVLVFAVSGVRRVERPRLSTVLSRTPRYLSTVLAFYFFIFYFIFVSPV